MYNVTERHLLKTRSPTVLDFLDLIKVCKQLTRDEFVILVQSLLLFEYNNYAPKNTVCDFT